MRKEKVIDVCKNKNSGLCFIYIRETELGKALLVTPKSQVKPLELKLFDEAEEQNVEYLLNRSLLNTNQLQTFYNYENNRADEVTDKILYYFESISADEQKNFIQRLQEVPI